MLSMRLAVNSPTSVNNAGGNLPLVSMTLVMDFPTSVNNVGDDLPMVQ
jgi:hypothetical protein